jgi:hypothetical protein
MQVGAAHPAGVGFDDQDGEGFGVVLNFTTAMAVDSYLQGSEFRERRAENKPKGVGAGSKGMRR